MKNRIQGAGHYESEFSIELNDEGSKVLKDAVVKLELDVVTIWGIKRTTFEILQAVIGVFCFILMYPLLHDRIRNAVIL